MAAKPHLTTRHIGYSRNTVSSKRPGMPRDLDTTQIKDWRSIITLVVFVLANVIVLFPFKIPVYIPRPLRTICHNVLGFLRIIPPRRGNISNPDEDRSNNFEEFLRRRFPGLHLSLQAHFSRYDFPMNFVTAPLIAVLFLLAILAIGRTEVYDGTVGANHIFPIDIMAFFITLAYLAISIDASGLIRWLAFKVLQKGGKNGHLLFLYLCAFFFALASFIGNDPIVLSGTPFLAYMTRASENIENPKAWIFTQFSVANIASAILVSSNPTNLVLAGAFNIKFIVYTANMIIPVLVTVIILFPFLLWVLFRKDLLIPRKIKLHEISDEAKAKDPVNPNVPFARQAVANSRSEPSIDEQQQQLEEIMNPFLDKHSAAFGSVVMAATLITILVVNAINQTGEPPPAYWVTLPAAVIMFCWEIVSGWRDTNKTRAIAREGRAAVNAARLIRTRHLKADNEERKAIEHPNNPPSLPHGSEEISNATDIVHYTEPVSSVVLLDSKNSGTGPPPVRPDSRETARQCNYKSDEGITARVQGDRTTVVSLTATATTWCSETFPTAAAVMTHLPLALVPFALCMFVLVEALVTKGWVSVFAYGWGHWIERTGTIGAIGGMGFLSVVLCNFAGTNIGTTILLCRVVQAWVKSHETNHSTISDRTFWGAVYSMAIGVNYGAFSTAFSASLAGLLWRDILRRKQIFVRQQEFAWVNLPIITIAMLVGLVVLVGEIYIIRNTKPFQLS